MRTGLFIEALILLLAAFLRLWELDIKPPHFDEGINGWFVDQMKATGFYRYDPENYHGPLYFYGMFVFLSLLGRNLWALRLPVVLASIASIGVAFRFKRFIGKGAAQLGGLALAVSPAAVFYGRYAIHESWLVLSLMITTYGLLGLWKEEGRRDLIITFAGATLLLLIKETGMIHIGCFLAAFGCLLVWQSFIPSRPALVPAVRCWNERDLAWCCVWSVLALIFFYSGTFLNWGGLPDFARAYIKWFNTGTGEGGHIKTEYQLGPFNYYWLALMGRYEWPALLGLIYAVRLAWPSPAMLRYLAIYSLGVLMAYSIIPYKTPWCIISILWPFTLLFGCAVEEAWERLPSKAAVALLASVLLMGSLFLTLRLNFRRFTDPKEPYVYVQTMPEIAMVTEPLLGLAARDPRNHSMSGQIVLESYYPLPWILGDFTRIGYYGKDNTPALLDGDFIVALASQEGLIQGRIREPYLRRRFHLRDSMDECMVWFREAVFGGWFAELGHGKVEKVMPGPPAKESTKDSAGRVR